MAVFILVCVLLIGLMLIYMYVESRFIIVRKYKLVLKSRSSTKGQFRVVQLSDIHKKSYPRNWEQLVEKVRAQSPNIIFITGDLVSRTETEFGYKGVLIEKLREICPVYLSRGNHELDLSQENMDRLRDVVESSGGVFLENESVEICVNGVPVTLYGADLKRSVYRNAAGGFSGLSSYSGEELEKDLGKSSGSPCLLLAHDPFFINAYAEWGADVTFSGHVHGGIINTPFGGLLSPERKFFPKYTKGIYEEKGRKMLVSTGIGKLRLFNPGEVVSAEISIVV